MGCGCGKTNTTKQPKQQIPNKQVVKNINIGSR